MHETAKRIRRALRSFINLSFAPYSVRILIYQLIGRNCEALRVATRVLDRKPLNWPLTKFVIEESINCDSQVTSQEHLSRFIAHVSQEVQANHELCSKAEYEARSQTIVDSLHLVSLDPRDCSRIDFFDNSDTLDLSLHIVSVGRFSNFIIQLCNALAIAKAAHVKDIYISRSDSLLSLFPILSSFTCKQSNISVHFNEPRAGFVISGFFFHVCRKDSWLYSLQSLRGTASSFRQETYFPQNQVEIDDKSASLSKELVIHVRSGDIFRSRNVQSDYGQPPLSYYTSAIKHFKPCSVTLVFEDEGNPVIRPLILFLENSKIPFQQQSSDLISDLRILSNAKALVMSRGTFAYGILCINDYLQTLYCFNSSREEDPLIRLHFSDFFYGDDQSVYRPSVVEVIDKKGYYFTAICSNNWKNTMSQRHLMVTYPAESLTIIEMRSSSA